jgi:hypothetical protein
MKSEYTDLALPDDTTDWKQLSGTALGVPLNNGEILT